MAPDNKKAAPGTNRAASETALDRHYRTPPQVTGQCAQVLNLIRERQPIISFDLTCAEIIPEAAARVHDLRCMGFNILTTIHPAVEFRGVIRRNVASYSLGSPEWPQPGFPRPNAGTPTAVLNSAAKTAAFLEEGARITKESADIIARGLDHVPNEDKQTHQRAILRNWRACLELSKASRINGDGA